MTLTRWLYRLAGTGAFLALSCGLLGCEDNNKWTHPNRDRYPAPPETTSTEQDSIDELEQAWQERASGEDGRARTNRAGSQAELPAAFEAARTRLKGAVERALERIESPPAPAVGGGPASTNTGEDDDANKPGDM